MNFADSVWCGHIPLNNNTYKFKLYISPDLNELRISFPQCHQIFIPVEDFYFQNNALIIHMHHIGEQYKLVLNLQDVRTVNGIVLSYNSLNVEFALKYESKYSLEHTSFQPYPSKQELIKRLKQGKEIDFSKLNEIVYPDCNDGYYKVLRDLYGLQNFFPAKSPIGKSITLTRWINKSIKQAGMVCLPIQRDGFTLLEHSLRFKKPLNCKGCSLILTDCLISLGVMARTVHCMSKDIFDPESHYITEMYAKDKNKWIAMDAAFGCFFESEGDILGIKEIREKLVEGQGVRVMSSRDVAIEKYREKIIYGMYKNFYRFEYYSSYEPGYASLFSNIKKILIEPACERRTS